MAGGVTNETVEKRRARQQARFLQALREGYSVTGAATKAGVDRRTVYRWRNEDEEFAAAWDDAWEARGDWYEDRNREQALAGNMAAILNGLRMHRRIVERQEITGANGAPFYVVVGEGLPSDVYGTGEDHQDQ